MKKTNLHQPFKVVLVINLVIVSLATVILFFVLKDRISSFCVYPQAIAISGVVFLWVLFHWLWRYIYPGLQNLSGTIVFRGLEFSGKKLINLFEGLHVRRLPGRALWFLLFTSVVALVIVLSPFSPFRLSESPPVIQSFSIQYLSTDLIRSYHPGEAIEIAPGQQVLVEAKVLGVCAMPCEWHAVNGVLLPGDKCSTLYTRSVGKGGDILTITVRSPCKTLQTSSSVFINP
jgi:hypothetical protein